MSDSELYSRLLFSKGQGYPLFHPQPFDDLPEPARRTGTEIGDVGLVTRDGAFDPIFNILRGTDDPSNRFGVPLAFEQIFLGPEDIATHAQFLLPGSDISNTTVSKRRLDVEAGIENNVFLPLGAGAVVEVSTNSKQTGLLLLPDGASRWDLRRQQLFRDYALKHAHNWYAFVNGNLQRMVGNGDLYLVTGVTKSTSWSVAAVENHSGEGQISLKLKAAQISNTGATYGWEWESGGSSVNSGPRRRAGEEEWRDNQTVFLRGFKIAVRSTPLRRAPKIRSIVQSKWSEMQSKSGFIPLSQPQASAAGTSMPSSPPQSSDHNENWLSRSPPSTTSSIGSSSDDEESLGPFSKCYHPSALINEYLLNCVLDATVAVTHDDEWASVLTMKESEVPDHHELIRRISNKFSMTIVCGGVCLQGEETSQDTIWIPMSGTNDSEDEHLFTSQMLQSVSYTDIAMVLQDTTEPVDLLQVDGQHHPSAGLKIPWLLPLILPGNPTIIIKLPPTNPMAQPNQIQPPPSLNGPPVSSRRHSSTTTETQEPPDLVSTPSSSYTNHSQTSTSSSKGQDTTSLPLPAPSSGSANAATSLSALWAYLLPALNHIVKSPTNNSDKAPAIDTGFYAGIHTACYNYFTSQSETKSNTRTSEDPASGTDLYEQLDKFYIDAAREVMLGAPQDNSTLIHYIVPCFNRFSAGAMSVNRLLNYANKYYYVRRERKSWDPPITVDNSREKISDRSKEKRADETKQWGYDREREKEGRMDELKKWGYQVDGLGESMASAEACAEAASPSDCIISFSSLAHRRFRTEVIEPLLAVPLVKGKKKKKIPKATTKATGAPLPKGRLARAVEELLESEGGDEAEKVRLIRDLAAVLRLVGVRPEHPLRQHLDILAQCISTKLKHGMRVFPL